MTKFQILQISASWASSLARGCLCKDWSHHKRSCPCAYRGDEDVTWSQFRAYCQYGLSTWIVESRVANQNLEIPIGRLGKPEEIAETVIWMVKTGYVNNKVIAVDGGMFIQ